MIDYGERLRIGMMLPSGNVIAEPQIRSMLPQGVQLYSTRLPLRGSSHAELVGMTEGIESATRMLADAEVDVIAFNCTAVSTMSRVMADTLDARMQAATTIKSFTTATAIQQALAALGAKRIVLLTPYVPEINEREKAFFSDEGLNIISNQCMGLSQAGEMAALKPATWRDFALENQDKTADAYLISCTAVRSAEAIEELESRLGRPVVTSNQAMVWHALRLVGLTDFVTGYGQLFGH
jgi:maleate isomerase